jgi:hypothetical protein
MGKVPKALKASSLSSKQAQLVTAAISKVRFPWNLIASKI